MLYSEAYMEYRKKINIVQFFAFLFYNLSIYCLILNFINKEEVYHGNANDNAQSSKKTVQFYD